MASEKRLIDANALVKIAKKRCGVVNIKHIDDCPTVDAVEVVLCENCKEYNEKIGKCDLWLYGFEPDDFCSYGNRREGEWS